MELNFAHIWLGLLGAGIWGVFSPRGGFGFLLGYAVLAYFFGPQAMSFDSLPFSWSSWGP